jgi:hypothetical protein
MVKSLMKTFALLSACGLAAAVSASAGVSGDYLEVRSCDVYTGPCFANAEMGLTGKEGMLFWSIRQGDWNGEKLDGLKVMAIVKTDATLGNLKYQPRIGEAVLIVDSHATPGQKQALAGLARQMGGDLLQKIVALKSVSIASTLGTCQEKGCASIRAGDLAEITTSCLSNKHDLCGNEETFYPPLSEVEDAYPVFTEVASYSGPGLDLTWQIAGKRSAFLGKFSASPAALAFK